jgi:hypothetical protein
VQLPNGYYLCAVKLKIIMLMNEGDKNYLSRLIMARMEAKSNIEYYRGLSEITGKYYEKEIDRNLDLISVIDALENELRKKK